MHCINVWAGSSLACCNVFWHVAVVTSSFSLLPSGGKELANFFFPFPMFQFFLMKKIPIVCRPLILFHFTVTIKFTFCNLIWLLLSFSTLHGLHGSLLRANTSKTPYTKMYMVTNKKHTQGEASPSPCCSCCNYSRNTNKWKWLTGCQEYFVLTTESILLTKFPQLSLWVAEFQPPDNTISHYFLMNYPIYTKYMSNPRKKNPNTSANTHYFQAKVTKPAISLLYWESHFWGRDMNITHV